MHMIILLGYLYLFYAILILALLTFNYHLMGWLIKQKNKKIYIRLETFFVFITAFVLFNSSPLNWVVGILMLFHLIGVGTLLFNADSFYGSIEEFYELTSQKNILELLTVFTLTLSGFLVLYSPLIIGS